MKKGEKGGGGCKTDNEASRLFQNEIIKGAKSSFKYQKNIISLPKYHVLCMSS